MIHNVQCTVKGGEYSGHACGTCDIQCQIKVIQNQTSRPGIQSQELNLLLNISYAAIAHISHRWLQWNDVILSKKKYALIISRSQLTKASTQRFQKMSNYHQDLIFKHPSYANSCNPDGSRGKNYHQTFKIHSILHNEIIQSGRKLKPDCFHFMASKQSTLKTMTVGAEKSLCCGLLHLNWSILCLNSEWQPGGFRRRCRGISEVLSITTNEPPPKPEPSQLPFLFLTRSSHLQCREHRACPCRPHWNAHFIQIWTDESLLIHNFWKILPNELN